MIIDYKNELLHEFSAINSVRNSYQQFIDGLQESEDNSDDQYIAPLNAILSCIAGSHKLDHIRLCCEENSKHSEIFAIYADKFDEVKQKDEREAIAKYQSANAKDKVNGLKPHQLINMHLNGQELKIGQRRHAERWVAGLRKSFKIASGSCTLQVGQRLYRGVTLNRHDLDKYVLAQQENTPMDILGFASTSLSESVATAFATLSHANRLQYLEVEEENPHIPSVLELTNRYPNLPFLLPDALRKPERSQGQMEILLPEGISLQPTYIDFSVQPVKIYADILKAHEPNELENEEE
ncbi:hypothetical protein CGT68_18315 [Vibrio cholerae]|uniref:hypothetical protein n=1 Tax=Vibrio TaxID=662 RepID=UPI000BA9B3AA|nr:hypothetical protein [Vibrio cholerae]PAS36809.1 hypothetical protein CGT69_18465 [Vibrio cholerae]PAS39612.1 hypothetical protein CGT68_18315 [Vibrio cholerae]